MDLRKLKKLIDLVEESGIAELELTEGEEKVKISRQVKAQQIATQYIQPTQIDAPQVILDLHQNHRYLNRVIGLQQPHPQQKNILPLLW